MYYGTLSRIVACAAALFLFTVSASAASYFTGNLNFAQEPGPPPVPSTATGFGRVTLNDAETAITVSVYYGSAAMPLTSNVTVGHIHEGAPGVSGPVVFDLAPTSGVTFGSVVNMTFPVTPAQVAVLKAGNYYFNIHTTNNPNGEIRGQILIDAPFVAYLDHNQENPPTNQPGARGGGVISLNSATNQLLVTMNWSGLTTPATAGHIHSGRVGVNGPIICDLTPGATTTGSVVDRLCTFSPTQVTALKQAQLYLNIHNSTNTGGQIRGQIQRRNSTVCDYDGDAITDAAIARNNAGIEWWVRNSSNGSVSVLQFGLPTDYVQSRIVCGDYDGDGKDDYAFWRTGASPNAFFFIFQSSDFTVRQEQFGTTGDDPRVVQDYDGDARDDIAVFRTSDDTWYFLGSSNNAAKNVTFVRWGATFANPGDYDGDGRGDFLDQQGANWWLLKSSDSSVSVTPLGPTSGAMFGTPGDYDGDGKTDVAGTLTETPNLAWYYVASSNPTQNVFLTRRAWGPSGGTRNRAQGDYDGDGKSDYAVWIEGATNADTGFWALPSNGAPHIFIPFGQSTAGTNDFPVAGYNNR